jgi:hypothetical protein
VALCLLGIALRLDRIGSRSLWVDELAAYGKAVLGPGDFVEAVSVNFNMVLYYLFINAYYHVYSGPFNEQIFRLPSAIFGTATIPLVFWLGRRCHSTTAGLLGALALSLNVFHVAYSQEARSYAAHGLVTAATWVATIRCLGSRRPGPAGAFVILTVANLYLHYYALVNAAIQLTVIGWQLLQERRLRAWIWIVLAVVVLCLPILYVNVVFEELDPTRHLGWVKPLTFQTLQELLRQTFGVVEPVVLLYALALGACLAYANRTCSEEARTTRLLLAGAALPIFGLALLGLAKPLVAPRYLLFVVPTVAALVGVGLAVLPRWQQAAGALLLLVASIDPLRQGAAPMLLPPSDWRTALASTVDRAQPGDGWIFLPEVSHLALDFYSRLGSAPDVTARNVYTLRGLTVGSPRIRRIDTESGPGLRGRGLPTEHATIWLIVAHDDENWARVVHDWLGEAGYEADLTTFPQIQIFRYRRLGQASATMIRDVETGMSDV